jgi:hypothetical protein
VGLKHSHLSPTQLDLHTDFRVAFQPELGSVSPDCMLDPQTTGSNFIASAQVAAGGVAT